MKFKLSEISKISNGKKAVFYDDGTVPVYGANGPIGTTQNSKYNVGDIVIGRVGANAGAVHRPISNFWASDNTMVVTPGERVRSEYLTWLLQKTNFNQMTSGSAQPLLNQDILNSIDFEIPGLSEQDYVISVIEPFENQMGVLTSINDNLRDLLQEKFKKIISETPAEFTTLQNLSPSIIAGYWGKDIPDEVNNSSVMVIRGADIPSISAGGKGQSPERYIKQAARIKKELKSSDVIVEISGGSPTQSTGRNLFISNDLLKRFPESVIGTNFTKVLRFSSYNQAVFAYFYLQYFYNAGLFFNYENGTTGIKNLDYKSVLKIPIRNVLESDSFVEFVQLFSIIERMRQTNGDTIETLTQAGDTLLAKLIN